MTSTADLTFSAAGPVATATVTRVDGGRVGLKSDAFGAVSARMATPHYRPRVGDSVLVVTSGDGASYVVGVLRALREVPDPLVAEDGSSAAIERDDEGEVMRVRDHAGRLVFEHRPDRSVVHAPSGDLELSTEGVLRLRGAAGIDAASGGAVSIRSGAGERSSELRLDEERARVRTQALKADVDRAEVRAKDVRMVVGALRTVAQRVRQRAEILEQTADRVVLKAKEAYQDVEGLSQTRAGRLRLVAEQALTALGERVALKARDDVKIKGDKIYLA